MKGVTHRSNTRAGKAPLPAHNRKPGVAAARDAARWRQVRRWWARTLQGWRRA